MDTSTQYAYQVKLTWDEEVSLHWLSDHGYDAGFTDAVTHIECDETHEHRFYQFSESDAWKVAKNYDANPEAFLECLGNQSLNAKLITFITNIV